MHFLHSPPMRTSPHNMHRLKKRLRAKGYRANIWLPAAGTACIVTSAAQDVVREMASAMGAVLGEQQRHGLTAWRYGFL